MSMVQTVLCPDRAAQWRGVRPSRVLLSTREPLSSSNLTIGTRPHFDATCSGVMLFWRCKEKRKKRILSDKEIDTTYMTSYGRIKGIYNLQHWWYWDLLCQSENMNWGNLKWSITIIMHTWLDVKLFANTVSKYAHGQLRCTANCSYILTLALVKKELSSLTRSIRERLRPSARGGPDCMLTGVWLRGRTIFSTLWDVKSISKYDAYLTYYIVKGLI